MPRFHYTVPIPPIEQGRTYYLKNCPPLDDDNVKNRPVIVIDDPATLKGGGRVMVLAFSTKDRGESGQVFVAPTPTNGLKKPSWAIPRWYFLVNRSQLNEPKGRITGKLLTDILLAYEAANPVDDSL